MNFRLKKISFFHREVMIICQNENGPCPLIGIANVLLLRGDMSFSSDWSSISLDSLVEQVANQVFAFFEKSSHRLSPENMTAILNVLPNLAEGLDVNVSFNGVDKMEYTEQIALFDALNIPLLHGWIYDPYDRETVETIGSLSYNHLVYIQVEYRSLVDKIQSKLRYSSQEDISASTTEAERKLLREGRIVDRFMKHSASQLTEQGLLKLHDFLQDRQLFVFFRNNHFSTVFYFQQQLFVLVTDFGYQDQPHVIWELLESVSGSGAEFFNSDFIPLRDLPLSVLNSSPGPMIDAPPTIAAPTVASPPLAPMPTKQPLMSNSAHPSSRSRSSTPVFDDSTQNPMIPSGKNSGLYDRDYEAAMRLHFQENLDTRSGASSMPLTSQGVSPAVVTTGGPMPMTMSQQQYHQQQLQHQQALLQQQTLLQQEYLQRAQLEQQQRQQQELTHLQQQSTPKAMLKGIPVEDDYEANVAPPDESNKNIVSPDLGMTQEELDRHTAMMLQFEEEKKAAKDRRRYEKRIRLRNRFLGLDETTGLDDGSYGGNDRSGCSIM